MDVNKFLKSGAIFSRMGSNRVTISWGERLQGSELGPLPCYYQNNFYLEADEPFVNFKYNLTVDKSDLQEKLASVSLTRLWDGPEKKSFIDFFNRIKKSKFDKMVPIMYDTATGVLSTEELSSCLYSLLSIKHKGSLYGCWGHESGMIGFSPEVLFNISKQKFKTMALAGTGSVTSEESLLDDSKERHEHQLVVDDIKQQLFNFSNKIETSEIKEISLKSLKHLKTEISADLESADVNKSLISGSIDCMHPTAALGLFPRSKSWKQEMKSIRESHPTENYGAPFGFIDKEGVEMIVAIRNLQWDLEKLYVGSGCGIVEQSDCDKEWKELKLKRDSVKKAIGIESL